MWILTILRFLISSLFIYSGFEKLIHPSQNFLYIVQAYELGYPWLEDLTVLLVPWMEFLLGIFLFLGLYQKWAARMLSVLVLSFIAVVGQALARGLPIRECGCFGELLSIPPLATLGLDLTLLFFLYFIQKKDVQTLSLDARFSS